MLGCQACCRSSSKATGHSQFLNSVVCSNQTILHLCVYLLLVILRCAAYLVFDPGSLWGVFIADVVIQSMGTDYARVVRAIFAFAQVSS